MSSPLMLAATRHDRQALFSAFVVCLAVLAWAMLALWSTSPYARYLDHGRWLDLAWFADICSAVPQAGWAIPALVHGFAWLLMIAAMMLPTSLPLLSSFGRVVDARADAMLLRSALAAGYVMAWMLFGIAAHALDSGVHRATATWGWLAGHGWVVGSAVMAGAGAFQFSALKYRCLERCRAPLGFLNARWRGKNPLREAFCVGFDHGLFCVGCCWALMLLMFVLGMGNVGWMLVIGLVMAAEKNLRGGRHLALPLGIVLLGSAAVTLVLHL